MFCRDIRELTGDEIRKNSRIGRSEVAVVFGGPPCQGISLIGKRDVLDSRNELLLEFVRIVSEIRPCYCVLENVAGLVVGDHRRLLDEVISQLEKDGYRVLDPRVLQAAEYGVPQSRRRLFLIGIRRDMPTVAYPDPSCTPRAIKGTSVVKKASRPLGPSVAEALFDLPDIESLEELFDVDESKARLGVPSEYARKLRSPESDPDNFASPRDVQADVITSSARTRHTEKSIKRFEATSPGATEPVSRFLRLHPDGIANTLRAGTASDRGAYTAPRPIHPVYPRVITVREAARLHSYPDWFRFHVTKWNGFREVGNSVPVFLGRSVAASIMKGLGVEPIQGSPCEPGEVRLLHFTQREAEAYYGLEERVIPQRNRKK